MTRLQGDDPVTERDHPESTRHVSDSYPKRGDRMVATYTATDDEDDNAVPPLRTLKWSLSGSDMRPVRTLRPMP